MCPALAGRATQFPPKFYLLGTEGGGESQADSMPRISVCVHMSVFVRAVLRTFELVCLRLLLCEPAIRTVEVEPGRPPAVRFRKMHEQENSSTLGINTIQALRGMSRDG